MLSNKLTFVFRHTFICSNREYPNKEHYRTGKSDGTYIHSRCTYIVAQDFDGSTDTFACAEVGESSHGRTKTLNRDRQSNAGTKSQTVTEIEEQQNRSSRLKQIKKNKTIRSPAAGMQRKSLTQSHRVVREPQKKPKRERCLGKT